MNLWRMSLHASLLIREQPWYRRGSFEAGLRAVGYTVDNSLRPSPENILVIWNRYGHYDHLAKQYEERGGRVIVAENGYLGREWNGGYWYAISLAKHNSLSTCKTGPEARFDIPMLPRRESGKEILVLETRSIGPDGVKEPLGWSKKMAVRIREEGFPVRIRKHPGENKCVSLEKDLENTYSVVTWGSGGALKAMFWGLRISHGYPDWIGQEGATRTSLNDEFYINCNDREAVARRLSWAMWNTKEIETGEPFKWLLQ